MAKALRSIIGVILVTLVAGCSVGPTYINPVFGFAPSFAARPTGRISRVPILQDNVAWWQKFNDPVLSGMVQQALAGNLDLALATERIAEAQARALGVPSAVSVTGNVDAGRRGESDSTKQVGNGVRGDFGLSWLLDPYGGRDARIRAAKARIEVADAERDAARLLLLSNIVTAYVDLRFQQRVLHLRQRELRSRLQTRRRVLQLSEASVATRLDVVRAKALVLETQGQIPTAQAAIRVQHNRIAVLLGKAPGTRGSPLNGGGQPVASMPVNIGIPADLVRNRPDIRIAERMYYARVAQIGEAEARLYPALSLGGEISLSRFGGQSVTDYFFGPTLTLPALPNGARAARVKVRESQARQALTGWKSLVLTAIEQVESALQAYAGSRSSVAVARKAATLRWEAVTLTRTLIAEDSATIRDLLDAESDAADANNVLAEGLRQLGRDFVVLNVSLGSGNSYDAAGEAN